MVFHNIEWPHALGHPLHNFGPSPSITLVPCLNMFLLTLFRLENAELSSSKTFSCWPPQRPPSSFLSIYICLHNPLHLLSLSSGQQPQAPPHPSTCKHAFVSLSSMSCQLRYWRIFFCLQPVFAHWKMCTVWPLTYSISWSSLKNAYMGAFHFAFRCATQ